MSGETPKLFVNKPKKAQLKQFQQQKMKAPDMQSSSVPPTAATSTSAAAMAGSTSSGGGAIPTPPQAPKESFARRYKFLWPILLGVNFVVGAYLFTRTKKKDIDVEEESPISHPSSGSTSISVTPTIEKPSPAISATTEPVKPLPPIPENQQRELFKWILEEKRKMKPKDPEEKKRVDQEKEILKQFIRAKPLPSI